MKKICFLFFCAFSIAPGYGQILKQGQLEFERVIQNDKPVETMRSHAWVYEDNVQNKGKKIRMYIELVPAKDNLNKQAPLFIIMGGPGQAATDLVSFFAEIFSAINQNSDLVFIDQRGTGKSNPFKFKVPYKSSQDYLRDEFMNDTILREQYRYFKANNNLLNYGTYNAIRDIENIRKKMGYHKINLYATSYSTRVALSYMNLFPGFVRTATLKGLVPDDVVIPIRFSKDAQRSFDLLVEDCKKQYPNFMNDWKHFYDQKFPLKTHYTDPETKKKEILTISKEVVALNMRVMLMSPSFT